jgi:hypothetical protein
MHDGQPPINFTPRAPAWDLHCIGDAGLPASPVNFPTLLRQPAENLTEVSRSAIRESSAAQPS